LRAITSELASSFATPSPPEPLMRVTEIVECLQLRIEGHPKVAAGIALWRAKAGRPDALADRVEKGLAGPEELKAAADILRGVAQNEWSYDETIRNLFIWQYVLICKKLFGLPKKVSISFVTEKCGIKERQVYDILKKVDALSAFTP
jgi:hypothetical protein